MSTTDNHRSWAKHYDEVNRRCFGEYYDQLTQQTLEQIGGLGSGLRIADFGAGTGRLAIPLAAAGHQVTAIEPSKAMLEQLEAKPVHGRIQTHHASLSSYAGPGGHNLALAVFTVIAYILTPEDIVAAFANAARALNPQGALLIDVPRPILFGDNHVRRDDLVRIINFTSIGHNLYRYEESTELKTSEGPVSYNDQFELRYWTQDEIRAALSAAGLTVTEDWSARFPMAGADYWLCRKTPKI
jgi:SAM-dependent methyltransferase